MARLATRPVEFVEINGGGGNKIMYEASGKARVRGAVGMASYIMQGTGRPSIKENIQMM